MTTLQYLSSSNIDHTTLLIGIIVKDFFYIYLEKKVLLLHYVTILF